MLWLSFGVLLYRLCTTYATTYPPPNPCIWSASQLGYYNGTMLSSSQTFMNCLNNTPDANMLPSYYNNKFNGIVSFSAGLTLSNLIRIDEIDGTVQMSFSLGLSWIDNRFAMPLFWSAIYPTKNIDLTNLLQNQNLIGSFYLPQVRYPDATDVQVIVTDITLSNKNLWVVKQAVVVTMVQSSFSFQRYPGDTQDIQLRFYVYPYPNTMVTMSVYGAGIYQSTAIDGQYTFSTNQVWSYVNATASTYVSSGASSGTSYWIGQIYMKRKGSGIVLRLVVPLFLLLLLSSTTFWMSTEKRVDVTITIMLSVSALYIVILGNIPLVGYLTDLDKFVFWMFFMLVNVITLHQIYATLKEKHERWPLRVFFLRIIETLGRCLVVPFIVIYFVNTIPITSSQEAANAIIYSSIAISLTIFSREFFGLRTSWKNGLQGLVKKVNDDATTEKDMSWLELLILNWWKFDKLSISTAYVSAMLSKNEKLDTDFRSAVSLKNVTTLQDLLVGDRSSTRFNNNGDIMMTNLAKATTPTTYQQQQRQVQDSGSGDVEQTSRVTFSSFSVTNPMSNHNLPPISRSGSMATAPAPATLVSTLAVECKENNQERYEQQSKNQDAVQQSAEDFLQRSPSFAASPAGVRFSMRDCHIDSDDEEV